MEKIVTREIEDDVGALHADDSDIENEEDVEQPSVLLREIKVYQRWFEQAVMFHVADFYQNKFFVAKDIKRSIMDKLSGVRTSRWVKIYRSFSHYDEFAQYQDSLKYKNCYELLRSGRRVKPYWDLEWLSHDKRYTVEKVLGVVKDYVQKVFLDLFGKQVREDNFRVMISHNQKRYSVHLVLHGVGALANTYEEMNSVNIYLIELLKRDGVLQDLPIKAGFIGSPIDSHVYSRNRLFRMLGHYKTDEVERTLNKVGEYPDREYFISVDTEKMSRLVFKSGFALTAIPESKKSDTHKFFCLVYDRGLGKFQINYLDM